MKRLQVVLLAGVLAALPSGEAMALHSRTVFTDSHYTFGHRVHRGSCTVFGSTFKTSACSRGRTIREDSRASTIGITRESLAGIPCPSTTTCLAIDSLLDVSTWTTVWSGTPCAVRRAPERFVAYL